MYQRAPRPSRAARATECCQEPRAKLRDARLRIDIECVVAVSPGIRFDIERAGRLNAAPSRIASSCRGLR
jgi:hypothetical protein